MTHEFKLALSLSVGLHAVALAGVSITQPPVFDVERGPSSVELYLVSPPQPAPHPRQAPQDALPEPPVSAIPEEPEPSSQAVITPEQKGASADILPGYLRNPPPVYPKAARARGEDGTVLLEVEVLATGRCGTVNVLTSSGHERLDEVALQAVRHWVFRPARRFHRPVTFWVEIPITFQLIDRHGAIEPSEAQGGSAW